MPSPWTLGRVTTRRSTWRPSTDQPDAPVLGQAPLGDVELGHDLHARDHPGGHLARHRGDVLQDAVDPEADPYLLAVGREVDIRGAPLDRLGDDLVDELDDRRILVALVQRDDLGVFFGLLLLGRVLDDVFEAVQARDQRRDVIRRGDRDADLVAGHDRDVVDREHVRRIGHRNQQRALVGECHRDRLVALGDRGRDEVGGGHVDLEDAEVEMVEAVALGKRAGERRRWVSAPFSSRIRSGVVPSMREASIASSTCSRVARPISTITSVRKRGLDRDARGGVSPTVCGGAGTFGASRGGSSKPESVSCSASISGSSALSCSTTTSGSSSTRCSLCESMSNVTSGSSAAGSLSEPRSIRGSPSVNGIPACPSPWIETAGSAPARGPSIPKIACRSGPAFRSLITCTPRRACAQATVPSRAARRMTSSGGVRPVHISKLSAP